MPSPQPSCEYLPSAPSPHHQPSGDHPGREPSKAITAPQLSSLGQVSFQISRLERVLEEPWGPAPVLRAHHGLRGRDSGPAGVPALEGVTPALSHCSSEEISRVQPHGLRVPEPHLETAAPPTSP